MIYLDDPDFTLHVGDVRDVLRTLPDASVDCVVTSPPYWGLRDYGAPGQLGLEATPQAYVAALVAVFQEVRRVLAPTGTVWLNLGDSYVANAASTERAHGFKRRDGISDGTDAPAYAVNAIGGRRAGLKPKDLVGIPWRVALALQADGWYLRSDIIWSKPNPMPESVTDRPTKAHEYVFLLSQQRSYYFDQDAVREPWSTTHAPGSAIRPTHHYAESNGGNDGLTGHLADVKARLRDAARPQAETLDGSDGEAPRGPDGRRQTGVQARDGSHQHRDGERWPGLRPQTARAHELAEQAGLTQAHLDAIRAVGITDVGKARVTQSGTGKNDPAVQALADEAKAVLGGYYREFLLPASGRNIRSVWTIPTQPYAGAHFATYPEELVRRCIAAGCPAGGVVLDPFMGSGTTALVARKLGRRSVGIELNPDYARLCADRLQQLSLLADAT